MEKEALNGTDNGLEMDNPFEEVTENVDGLTKTEFLAKTNKDLRPFIKPYTTLSDTTLAKFSKLELWDIYINRNNPQEQKQAKGRAARNQGEGTDLITMVVDFLEGQKIKRDQQPFDAKMKERFINNTTNKMSEKVSDDTMHTASTALIAGLGVYFLIDGLVGIANIPKKISELKSKREKPSTK